MSPGVYRGTVEVKDGDNRLSTLKMDIKVSSRVLPAPSQWAFHLDLWQSPFAVARYYQVPLWSQAHIDAMRPVMKMLADAGQKIITASIMHKHGTDRLMTTLNRWLLMDKESGRHLGFRL